LRAPPNARRPKAAHAAPSTVSRPRRDCEWMSPIYHGLGITCGYIQSEMDSPDRRKAYDCDITYGTNSEFGFDYLRDNMKPARWGDPNYPPYVQQCQKELNYAIIDEVDNILIDEARTPLIISGAAFSDIRRYARANEIAVQLTELEKKARAALRHKDQAAPEGDGAKKAPEAEDAEEKEVNLTEELPEDEAEA